MNADVFRFVNLIDSIVDLFKVLFGGLLDAWIWMSTPMSVHLAEFISDLNDLGLVGDILSILLTFMVSLLGSLSAVELMLGIGLTSYLGIQLYHWISND